MLALKQEHQMSKLKVLGIMSGTSLDGVDFVLSEIQKQPLQLKFLKKFQSEFPKLLRDRLVRAAKHDSTVNELAILHHDLGRYYSREILKHKKAHRFNVDLIGLHGQTVFHQP